MSVFYVVAQTWGETKERILVPEHTIRCIIEETNPGRNTVVKVYLFSNGAYTVNTTLENFLDSCRVEV